MEMFHIFFRFHTGTFLMFLKIRQLTSYWQEKKRKTKTGQWKSATPECTCIYYLWALLKWHQRGDESTKDSFGEIAEFQWEAFSLIAALFEVSVKQCRLGVECMMRHLFLLEKRRQDNDDVLYIFCMQRVTPIAPPVTLCLWPSPM